MFVRVVRGYGKRYMHVVESYWKGKVPTQRVLWPLGKYDHNTYLRVKHAIASWRRLKKITWVLKEIEDPSGPVQGKNYFIKYKNR